MSVSVALDPAETRDIWEIFHRNTFMNVSRNAFIAMVLHTPLKITLAGVSMNKELVILFELYWTDWMISKYDWLQCFGVAPWFIQNVSGTHHRFPKVPKFNSGHIETYLDSHHNQQFKWFWKDGGEDKSFFFDLKSHAPDVDGHYTSPISTLLNEWRTVKIVRESIEIASYRQARTQHVFEFHPPKNVQGDDNLINLESFGDNIACTVMSQQEGLQNAKYSIRADELQRSLASAAASNRGLKARFGVQSFLKSEGQDQRWERENANVLENGIPLRPDYSYKPVPSPNVHANLPDICARFDRMTSAILDVPLSIIEAMGGKTTANVQGGFRFLNERVKDWQEYYKRSTKRAFLILYGDELQKDLNHRARIIHSQRPDIVLNMYIDTHVEVEMAYTPIANVADIERLHETGFMKKKVAGAHIFNVLGMPLSDLHVTKNPDLLVEALPPVQKKVKI